jgi:CYTH domain-containing protein
VDADAFQPQTAARAALAGALGSAASRFRGRLELVRAVTDQAEAHRARLEAKRLRYLMEPYRDEDAGVRAVVKELKELQRLLGELHDVNLLRGRVSAEVDALPEDEEAVRAGLMVLLEQLRARLQEVFDEVYAGWLRGGAEPFFERVQALATRMAGRENVEIERKYLLRELPQLPEGAEWTWIEQGWLPGEKLLERLRRVSSEEGERLYRTVKAGMGVRRMELEEPTTPELFRALWPLTAGRRVRKQRFRVPEGEVVWEVDSFPDHGIVLAEIELDSEDAEVTFPAWLEPHVEREVTDEEEYVNINLAR